MTVGLEVTNDAGYFQIADANKNLVFKAKGTVTCSTSVGSSVAIYQGSFTVTSNGFPFVALRSSSHVGIVGATVSGSTWTIYVNSNVSGASVDWYQFDTPDAGASPENYGLEIFAADGSRSFHSALKPLRIVGVRDAGGGSATYTSGRTYAACQTADGYSWLENAPVGKGAGLTRAWQAGASWSAETISVPWAYATGLQIDNIGSGTTTQSYTPPTPKFIVVDVTGY